MSSEECGDGGVSDRKEDSKHYHISQNDSKQRGVGHVSNPLMAPLIRVG
jgi:hypothetical protein